MHTHIFAIFVMEIHLKYTSTQRFLNQADHSATTCNSVFSSCTAPNPWQQLVMATGTSYTIQSCTRKFLQYIILARHIFSLSLANTCCMTDKQSVTRTYIHVVHLHDYMIVKFDVHVQYIYRLNCCQTTYSILTTLSAQTKLLHTRWMHVIFFTFNHKQNVNFSNTNCTWYNY